MVSVSVGVGDTVAQVVSPHVRVSSVGLGNGQSCQWADMSPETLRRQEAFGWW